MPYLGPRAWLAVAAPLAVVVVLWLLARHFVGAGEALLRAGRVNRSGLPRGCNT